jgi:hypothetical protein
MVTNFIQGNIGGGGYAYSLQMAPNGSMLVSGNTPNLYRYKASTGRWDNVSVSPNMDSIGIGPGLFGTVYSSAWGPDSQRIYSVFPKMPSALGVLRGAYHMGQSHNAVFRSDDAGSTWSMTGLTNIAGFNTSGPGAAEPLLYVDPNNVDICYVMDVIGIVHVTYNGGSTWSVVNTLMTMLPTATVVGNYTAFYAPATVTVNANPISGLSTYFAYDSTNPLALGTDYNTTVFGGTATTMLLGPLATLDGSANNGNSLRNNDVLYFGQAGGVIIDPSFGTVPNPGGSGLASKVVYFAWQRGATSMWWTQDGNPEHATAMGGGGPAQVSCLSLSGDGALGNNSGNNILYVAASTAAPFWRWVAKNPQTGSGLSDNTWTNLTTPGAPDGVGKVFPDPQTLGRAVHISNRGHTNELTSFGTSFSGPSEGNFPPMVAGDGGTDAPWMTLNDPISLGGGAWDPTTSNKLFICDGNGVWWKSPTTSSTTWTTAMNDLQSLILTMVLKTPSPNGRIYITCQDHVYAYSGPSGPTSTITCDYGRVGNPTNGYGLAYNPANPNHVFVSAYSSGMLLHATNAVTFNPLAYTLAPPNPAWQSRGGATSVNVINSIATVATVSAGGTGYAVGNTIILTGGTFSTPVTLTVATLSGSAVATVTITNAGVYSSVPSNPVAQGSTSGGGSGATFNVTWSQGGAGYTNGTYNGVALTGSPFGGSGATANITVAGGRVTAVTIVNNGDFYYDGELLSASTASIGGTGSGFSFYENISGSFKTTNTSATVIGTFVGHGFTSPANAYVRFLNTSGTFNNVNLEDKVLSMSVVDADHISITAPTTANASGWGGGLNTWLGANACVPGNYIGIGVGKIAVVNPSVGVTNAFIAATYCQYGTFNGTSWRWDYSLVNGTTKLLGNSGGPYSVRNYVTKTDNGVIFYFDGDATGGSSTIYKSVDGGATLTVASATPAFIFGAGAGIASVPGYNTHLFLSPGASGEAVVDITGSYLWVSTDSGATWNSFPNTSFVISVTVGLPMPGATYPSVYFVGRTLADIGSNTSVFMYRADDVNVATRTATWQRLDNSKLINCDGWLGGIHPDPETPGTFYVGTNDTGYLVGVEDDIPPPPEPSAGVEAIRSMTNTYGKTVFKRIRIPQA